MNPIQQLINDAWRLIGIPTTPNPSIPPRIPVSQPTVPKIPISGDPIAGTIEALLQPIVEFERGIVEIITTEEKQLTLIVNKAQEELARTTRYVIVGTLGLGAIALYLASQEKIVEKKVEIKRQTRQIAQVSEEIEKNRLLAGKKVPSKIKSSSVKAQVQINKVKQELKNKVLTLNKKKGNVTAKQIKKGFAKVLNKPNTKEVRKLIKKQIKKDKPTTKLGIQKSVEKITGNPPVLLSEKNLPFMKKLFLHIDKLPLSFAKKKQLKNKYAKFMAEAERRDLDDAAIQFLKSTMQTQARLAKSALKRGVNDEESQELFEEAEEANRKAQKKAIVGALKNIDQIPKGELAASLKKGFWSEWGLITSAWKGFTNLITFKWGKKDFDDWTASISKHLTDQVDATFEFMAIAGPKFLEIVANAAL